MLEIVEDEQRRVADVLFQIFFQNIDCGLLADFANSEGLHDCGRNGVWFGQRREWDEIDSAGETVGETSGDFDSETRFADATWAGHGDEADIRAREEFSRSLGFPF